MRAPQVNNSRPTKEHHTPDARESKRVAESVTIPERVPAGTSAVGLCTPVHPAEPQATRPGHILPLRLPVPQVAYWLMELQIQFPEIDPDATLHGDTEATEPLKMWQRGLQRPLMIS